MTHIIVSGAIANKYRSGGAAWTRLSWVLGLQKLGCEVTFVEQIRRDTCLDAAGAATEFAQSANLAYFKDIVAQFDLAGAAALIYEDGAQIYGLSESELTARAARADLLVNISGHLTWAPVLGRVRRKAYIDQDPGFTQFWYAAGSPGLGLEGYDFYFTVGENIGAPLCPIPTGGIAWRPLPQPVVLDRWPVASEGSSARFTTVGSWRGPYGPVESGGTTYGLKVHEFRKFIVLPERVPQTCEIALSIHPADDRDRQALEGHGWRLVDPLAVAGDPEAFRRYVQTSGAEFSVAQGMYVQTESGWFSDRTARYLASGKPALVQDTGWTRNYPAGAGLLAFRTLDEAVAGAQSIAGDYAGHCRAARALAETYFDSDKVLGRFLEEVGLAGSRDHAVTS